MGVESVILDKIRRKNASLAILGLGHVGLPTALIFADAGFKVSGVDIDERKVESLRQGVSNIAEPGLEEILKTCLKSGTFSVNSNAFEAIRASDIVSICVPTPIKNSIPDLTAFKAAFDAVKRGAHSNMVVLTESTLPPSTTITFAAPQLESVGYRIDHDIFLAYCPERIAPTQALNEFQDNTRIVGGTGPRSCKIAQELYKTVCKDVMVTDALTAEITKVAENTFRDLNIAYANLLALISERLGADVIEVIRLANTHPRVSILKPGLGVGGPCLPKDPYILIHGVPLELAQFVRDGRKLNDCMTKHAVNALTQTRICKGAGIRDAKVAVLGVAYKSNAEDVTNSPAEPLIEELLRNGASVSVYDPYTHVTFGAERAPSMEDAIRDADCIVIVTGHTYFKSIDSCLEKHLAKPDCVIFDGPRQLDPKTIKSLGLTYLGTGYGSSKLSENETR